jgi:hypothetical protein
MARVSSSCPSRPVTRCRRYSGSRSSNWRRTARAARLGPGGAERRSSSRTSISSSESATTSRVRVAFAGGVATSHLPPTSARAARRRRRPSTVRTRGCWASSSTIAAASVASPRNVRRSGDGAPSGDRSRPTPPPSREPACKSSIERICLISPAAGGALAARTARSTAARSGVRLKGRLPLRRRTAIRAQSRPPSGRNDPLEAAGLAATDSHVQAAVR